MYVDTYSLVTQYFDNYRDTLKVARLCKNLYNNKHNFYIYNHNLTSNNLYFCNKYILKNFICHDVYLFNINKYYEQTGEYILNNFSDIIPFEVVELRLQENNETFKKLDLSGFKKLKTIRIESDHYTITNYPNSVENLYIYQIHNTNDIAIPKTLKKLFLYKNTKISNIPENLEYLYINCYNHQKITELPKSLKTLKIINIHSFECEFLPENLEVLHVECNIKKMDYPNSLKKICFGRWSAKVNFDTLPEKITDLDVLDCGSLPMNLPESLINLKISQCSCKIHHLPNSLKHFEIHKYKHNLPPLPNNLVSLVIYDNDYIHELPELPESLEILKLSCYKHALKKLPSSIRLVEIGDYKFKIPSLPKIERLKITCYHKHNIPPKKNLIINIDRLSGDYEYPLLPETIKSIEVYSQYREPYKQFPSNLESIIITGNISNLPTLPSNLKKLSIKSQGKSISINSNFPESMEHLSLCNCIINNLPKLSKKLKYLELDCNINSFQDNFPPTLTTLILKDFNLNVLPDLPEYLKILRIENCCPKIIKLPESLEKLYLGTYYCQPIPNIPENIKLIELNYSKYSTIFLKIKPKNSIVIRNSGATHNNKEAYLGYL